MKMKKKRSIERRRTTWQYETTHISKKRKKKWKNAEYHLVVYRSTMVYQSVRTHFVRMMFRFMLNKLNAWIRFCRTFHRIFFCSFSLFFRLFFLWVRAFCSSYFNEMIWSLLEGLHFILWFQCGAWQYVHSAYVRIRFVTLFVGSSLPAPNYHLSIKMDDGKQWTASVFFHLINMFRCFGTYVYECVWTLFPFRENHIKKWTQKKRRINWILNFDAFLLLTSSSLSHFDKHQTPLHNNANCDAKQHNIEK